MALKYGVHFHRLSVQINAVSLSVWFQQPRHGLIEENVCLEIMGKCTPVRGSEYFGLVQTVPLAHSIQMLFRGRARVHRRTHRRRSWGRGGGMTPTQYVWWRGRLWQCSRNIFAFCIFILQICYYVSRLRLRVPII